MEKLNLSFIFATKGQGPGMNEQPLSNREIKKVRNIILSSGTSTSYFEIAVHEGFSEGAHRLLSHGPLGPSENNIHIHIYTYIYIYTHTYIYTMRHAGS